LLEYLAQELTPPNTVYANQKVPSEFWVPGSHTISFSSHGVFFLLKVPIRSENHLPFLNSEVGYGEVWERVSQLEIMIRMWERDESKVLRKHLLNEIDGCLRSYKK